MQEIVFAVVNGKTFLFALDLVFAALHVPLQSGVGHLVVLVEAHKVVSERQAWWV